MIFSRTDFSSTLVAKAWGPLRDHAALHRGLWLAAPVFWAAFAVFIHPGCGAAGFALHCLLCLPRGKTAAAALFLAGPLLALWFAAREPALTLPAIPLHKVVHPDETPREWTGIVASFPARSARGFSFLFKTEGRLYRVNLESGRAPAWGATVRFKATVEAPVAPPNPGQLDMRRVIRAQGAAALLRAAGASGEWTQAAPPPAWKTLLLRARASLDESLARHVPRAGLPLLEAALLNNVDNVAPDTQQAFLRSGMQHILAISGQHIALLIAFLLAIALCVRLPRKAAFILAGLLAAAYIPLTGAPVSVVRSGLMLACLMPGVLLERSSAGLHALCLTAALDLLIDPFNILNLGFQLSYGATLALILCSRPSAALAEKMFPSVGAARGILQMIFLSIMVTLFTYVPLAASTHSMAPWGILGNLLTVPVSSVMLVGGLCVWSLDLLLPAPLGFLATWAGAVTGFSAVLLEGCVFFLARLPGALRPIADAPAFWLAAFSVICAAVVALLRAEKYRLGCLVVAALVAAEILRPLVSRPWPGEARITFLAVGHGDAAVVELPGAVLLIDAGDSPRIAQQIIAPFLRYRGIGRVDAVLITHPDLDHYGGAAALLDLVPVGRIIGPPQGVESSVSWDCLRYQVKAKKIEWREGRAGQRVYTGPGVSLWMLGPGDSLAGADKNNRSLVALLTIAGRSGNGGREEKVLFTGDIEGPGQRALEPIWPLWRGAWLKAPHHGSDRTTLPCFIEAAAAPRAVISCGSRRGFPGPNTLESFRNAGTKIQITKHEGAVIWKFYERSYFTNGFFEQPGPPKPPAM